MQIGNWALITARYPEAIFTAIETTGEVNVQSRVQMDLFKARKRAESEFRDAVLRSGFPEPALEAEARKKAKALAYSPHVVAGTAANQVLELATQSAWPSMPGRKQSGSGISEPHPRCPVIGRVAAT